MKRNPAALQAVTLFVCLAGCAAKVETTATDGNTAPPAVAACRDLYRDLDELVDAARVADAQSTRIDGYPYLRIDRFLAADAVRPRASDDAFDVWVASLRDLDLQARHHELRNLPPGAAGSLDADSNTQLGACADRLIGFDLSSADDRARLLETARADDDYSVAKRVFGLYPFTSIPFKAGVDDYHESVQVTFSRPLDTLPVEGRLTRYRPSPDSVPMSAESVSHLLRSSATDDFGRAKLSPAERQRLFASFAPVYEVDVVGDDDRIGMPVWTGDVLPSVDVARPVVFRRISHTIFEGQVLVQLNYSVWFPARPSDGEFDLLSGHLDGITFRVTLGRDGRPLIYDSMHNCGCYHLFLPTPSLDRGPPSGAYEEPPLVPQQIERGEGRLVLRIAHRTHFLQRVYHDDTTQSGEIYAMDDDDSLRSLPAEDGLRRSLFGPDGLVEGSERGERWFFWPMGIAEPGAMRQWGHHATLFVGKRHFDDSDIIERYFRSSGGN